MALLDGVRQKVKVVGMEERTIISLRRSTLGDQLYLGLKLGLELEG